MHKKILLNIIPPQRHATKAIQPVGPVSLGALANKGEIIPTYKHMTSSTPDPIVGYIEVALNVSIPLTAMPNIFHRCMMRVFFGWMFIKETRPTTSGLLFD